MPVLRRWCCHTCPSTLESCTVRTQRPLPMILRSQSHPAKAHCPSSPRLIMPLSPSSTCDSESSYDINTLSYPCTRCSCPFELRSRNSRRFKSHDALVSPILRKSEQDGVARALGVLSAALRRPHLRWPPEAVSVAWLSTLRDSTPTMRTDPASSMPPRDIEHRCNILTNRCYNYM